MKAGEIVKVKVLSVDTKAKRIALSIKALQSPQSKSAPVKRVQQPPHRAWTISLRRYLRSGERAPSHPGSNFVQEG